MPTSQKQIEANRRNAKKSTGPRTPKGKAASSRNAIKHGLYACDIILRSPRLSEDRTENGRLLIIEETPQVGENPTGSVARK